MPFISIRQTHWQIYLNLFYQVVSKCLTHTETTKARLRALISFKDKVFIRLEKREDLPTILSILENLSKFTYAFLPEHQTAMNETELEELRSEGIKCLDRFVQEINKLADYPREERPHTREMPQQTWVDKIQLLYFGNVFFRFALWLILLLAIMTGLVYLVSLGIQGLDENVMVSLILGSSLTGAAALAVFGGRDVNAKTISPNTHEEHVEDISPKDTDKD